MPCSIVAGTVSAAAAPETSGLPLPRCFLAGTCQTPSTRYTRSLSAARLVKHFSISIACLGSLIWRWTTFTCSQTFTAANCYKEDTPYARRQLPERILTACPHSCSVPIAGPFAQRQLHGATPSPAASPPLLGGGIQSQPLDQVWLDLSSSATLTCSTLLAKSASWKDIKTNAHTKAKHVKKWGRLGARLESHCKIHARGHEK